MEADVVSMTIATKVQEVPRIFVWLMGEGIVANTMDVQTEQRPPQVIVLPMVPVVNTMAVPIV